MKNLIILLSVIFIGTSLTNDTPTPTEKINSIFKSSNFKISIERLDFGYVLNQQVYEFKTNENVLSVSQLNLGYESQKSSLNNTILHKETSQTLNEYCASIKSFELNKSDQHKELFNASDIHDFIYLTTKTDTVLLSDVQSKAINGIRNIIENNRK